MSPTREIQEAIESASGSVFGFLAWYDCENAHITPSRLSQLFNQYNMPKDKDGEFLDLPDDIRPKNAFQKACRKVMTEEGMSSDARKLVVKVIVDGVSKLVYGVVDLPVDQTAEIINPDFSDRVWFDKQTQNVSCDKQHPASLRIIQLYGQMCGEYNTRDIARMIVGTMDRMGVVSMRRAGVLYFIPYQFEKDLRALQSVVNSVGECDFQTLTLYGRSENTSAVEKCARNQINDKIQEMKTDLAGLKRSIEDEKITGKAIDNSIAVRLRRYKELKNKCSILADALKIKADTLMGDLESVGQLIKTELMSAA